MELRALEHLQEQGLVLLARNVRYRVGELDLVMRDGPIIIFVEVRFRARSAYGTAADSVSLTKQLRVRRAAALWLQAKRFAREPACRFDVVAIDGEVLRWIPNAFSP